MMGSVKSGIRAYVEPAFVLCVLVLATAGVGMPVAMKKLGVVLKKSPLPLRRSLELLEGEPLGPYKVVSKLRITNEDTLKALGTEDYIQWVLEDGEQSEGSAVKRLMLFVTYYRLPDRVPHVPEECWTGGGYQKLSGERVSLEVSNGAGFEAKVPGSYLIFAPKNATVWQSRVRIPNLYFFRVNGEYAGDRDEARIALNKNLFRKWSYFSKVEIVFNQSRVAPGREEAVAAAEKLLAVVLPVLESKYWPEWGDSDQGE